MSAIWGCPQELGQPVQCIRTGLVKVKSSSKALIIARARFLVSMRAKLQNCAPVQDTSDHLSKPGSRENLSSKGSVKNVAKRESEILG